MNASELLKALEILSPILAHSQSSETVSKTRRKQAKAKSKPKSKSKRKSKPKSQRDIFIAVSDRHTMNRLRTKDRVAAESKLAKFQDRADAINLAQSQGESMKDEIKALVEDVQAYNDWLDSKYDIVDKTHAEPISARRTKTVAKKSKTASKKSSKKSAKTVSKKSTKTAPKKSKKSSKKVAKAHDKIVAHDKEYAESKNWSAKDEATVDMLSEYWRELLESSEESEPQDKPINAKNPSKKTKLVIGKDGQVRKAS